jgi:hypothetical protein
VPEALAYSVTTVTASSSGNALVVTPPANRRVRLHYVCLNADGGNAADVTAALRYGVSGALVYTVSLKAGSIFARNIGAGRKHVDGAQGESLYVNLSAAQTVNVTIEWEESV